MGRRRYPIANVDLHYYGRRHVITLDAGGNPKCAWSAYSNAGKMMSEDPPYVQTATAGSLGVRNAAPNEQIPLAMYHCVNESRGFAESTPTYPSGLNVFMLAPLWAAIEPMTSGTPPSENWDVDPASVGPDAPDEPLVDEVMPEYGDQGVQAEVPLTMTSTFTVGRNCWWTLVLLREKTKYSQEDGAEYDTENLATEVLFGVWAGGPSQKVAWRIYWPRSKGPELHYLQGGVWNFACSINANTQSEEGECLQLNIGVLRGHIAIMDLADQSWTTYNSWNNKGSSEVFAWGEEIAASKITVNQNYGQMYVIFKPVIFTAATISGTITTPRMMTAIDTLYFLLGGYGVENGYPCYPVLSHITWDAGYGVEPEWLTTEGSLQVALRPIADTNEVQWAVRMVPYSYTDQGVTTMATPYWCSLSVWQEADLTDMGEPAVERHLTLDEKSVISIQCQEPADDGPATATLELYNRDGQAQSIKDARLLTISNVGWVKKPDGGGIDYQEISVDFMKLLTMEAEIDGRFNATMSTIDLVGTLALVKFDQGAPVFDSLPLTYALQWLLESVGIGEEWYDLEDLDAAISHGKWEEPRWQPERGRDYLAYIKELLETCGGNASIWSDVSDTGSPVIKTGCRYCRAKRTSSDWWTHNGPNSDGCRAADVLRAGGQGIDLEVYAHPGTLGSGESPGDLAVLTEVKRRSTRVDSDEYANYVSVGGEDIYGRKFAAVMQNPTDIAMTGLGYKIMRVEDPPGIQTIEQANMRLLDLYSQLSVDPIEITGTALFDPSLRRGRVIRTHTSAACQLNIDHAYWRIVSCNPRIDRANLTMDIVARKLGVLEPEGAPI